jgi:hypothetical protein
MVAARVDLCARPLASSCVVGARGLRIARGCGRELWIASACCTLGTAAGCTPTALDTVDLGDHPEPPEIALDEDFFHCEVQPKVLTANACASGGAGESGGCHLARSALRLVELPAAPVCQAGRVVGGASRESQINLERIRTSVGVDADASPLYRRPLGLDSHPRVIFAANSEPADILRRWLNGLGTP